MTYPAQVGRYRIIGELGRGGMGAVLRGVDPSLEREVAIKVIAPRHELSESGHQELIQRFLREAKLAARINHPGVVTVFDAGQDGSTLFLVLELIEGESLAQRLARGAYPDRSEALRIVADTADALAAAHALGVVHRDIKPSNIMLTRDGRVKVSDFGVAKAIGDDTGLTRTGISVGSPSYMSPEQVMGDELDGRADLFSLGVVLYQMLLRRKPFPADTITTLVYQILNTDPFEKVELSSLDQDTIELLRSCLAKSPGERAADAQTLAKQARMVAQTPAPGDDDQGTIPTMALPQIPPARAARVATTAGSRPVPPTPPPLPPIELTASRSGTESVRARRPLTWLLLPVVVAACALVVVVIWRRSPPTPEGSTGNDISAAELTPGPSPVAQPLPDTRQQVVQQIEPTHGADRSRAAEAPIPATAVPVPATAVPTQPPEQLPVARPTQPPVQLPAAVTGQAAIHAPTEAPLVPTPVPTPTPPISATYYCLWGVEFNVEPEEAQVAIDGRVIGIADEWDGSGGGQVYTFSKPGTYYARFSLSRYQTTWVKIVVSEDAEETIADIDTELLKN
jgi:serine/threonine-protein kinase